MKVVVCAFVVLLNVLVARGEKCRYDIPLWTSNLKCEDQLYHRPRIYIEATNYCAGQVGTEINSAQVTCVGEYIGFTKNGVPVPGVLRQMFQYDFPYHYEALLKGIEDCAASASTRDPYSPECANQVYQDVCKHKTCNWMNTLD